MRHTALALALVLAGGSLAAQQAPDSATLARARAVLHHDLFAVAGWPIVSVEVLRAIGDSVVVVRQRQDTVTLELSEGWSRTIAREGPLEACRRAPPRDIGNDCLTPRPYQIIEHVWLELRGPLPDRVRGELLGHLVQFTWSPARLRPN